MSVRSALVATAALALLPSACSGPSASDDVSAAETKLVERTLLEGHLKLLVPDHFTPLDETAIHARFHFDLASVVALQNGDGSIEVVAVLQTTTPGPAPSNEPTEPMLRLLGERIRRSYAAKKTLRDEVVTRDGLPIYFFEVAGALRERNRRIICAYTILAGQPLEVFFSCPEPSAAEWAPIGQRIIDSVAVTP